MSSSYYGSQAKCLNFYGYARWKKTNAQQKTRAMDAGGSEDETLGTSRNRELRW